MSRIKVSAAYNDFIKTIYTLEKLDKENQKRCNTGTVMAKTQLSMLTEGAYFSAYRAFETYMEEIFLLYSLGKPNISGKKSKSYLNPKDYNHAFELIKSSMVHLEWNNPDHVINRAETYLKGGEPVKNAISSYRQILNDMRRIRNHIAHNSKDSLDQYKKVVKNHYGYIPLKIPRPGEYLVLMVPRARPAVHYLIYYLDNLKSLAKDLSH